MTANRRRLGWLAVIACAAALVTSCAWQPYAAARAVQYAVGAPIRLHIVTPLDSSLRRYRVIEIAMNDLLPRELGGPVERELSTRLTAVLRKVSTSPAVMLQAAPAASLTATPHAPVLILDGIIDDYETGSPTLRAADLGFNHAAVTVRFQLRDKDSGRVLGAASITAQDGRPVGGARAAMNHLVHRVGAFVDQGYRRR